MNDQNGGTGSGSSSGAGTSGGPGSHAVQGSGRSPSGPQYFDHERLDVYQVAFEFLGIAHGLLFKRKLARELHDQFNSASESILARIGEGAGKTAKADKQRFYEMARGSTTEAATQLDIMLIRKVITRAEYDMARQPLLRVAAMLSRLCGAPRTT